MKYEILNTTLEDGNFIKYHIKESGDYLSFDEVLALFEGEQDFRSEFLALLNSVPYDAFNIEFPSVKIEDINKPFEFVVVKSDSLNALKADPSSFAEHFNNDELTAVFENLGGDAVLLSPNANNNEDFAHLRSFLNHATTESKHDLLIALGEIAMANVNTDPIWINTSGFGVSWLHIRLDDKPKYYKYEPYK